MLVPQVEKICIDKYVSYVFFVVCDIIVSKSATSRHTDILDVTERVYAIIIMFVICCDENNCKDFASNLLTFNHLSAFMHNNGCESYGEVEIIFILVEVTYQFVADWFCCDSLTAHPSTIEVQHILPLWSSVI